MLVRCLKWQRVLKPFKLNLAIFHLQNNWLWLEFFLLLTSKCTSFFIFFLDDVSIYLSTKNCFCLLSINKLWRADPTTLSLITSTLHWSPTSQSLFAWNCATIPNSQLKRWGCRIAKARWEGASNWKMRRLDNGRVRGNRGIWWQIGTDKHITPQRYTQIVTVN